MRDHHVGVAVWEDLKHAVTASQIEQGATTIRPRFYDPSQINARKVSICSIPLVYGVELDLFNICFMENGKGTIG